MKMFSLRIPPPFCIRAAAHSHDITSVRPMDPKAEFRIEEGAGFIARNNSWPGPDLLRVTPPFRGRPSGHPSEEIIELARGAEPAESRHPGNWKIRVGDQVERAIDSGLFQRLSW